MSKSRVLIVDDDELILAALGFAFRLLAGLALPLALGLAAAPAG